MSQDYTEAVFVNGQTCNTSYAFHLVRDRIIFERLVTCV